MTTKVKYKNFNSLNKINNLIKEAQIAVKVSPSNIDDSYLNKETSKVVATTHNKINYSMLIVLTIISGLVVIIGVLAVPIVFFTIGTYLLILKYKKYKLKKYKKILLEELIKTQSKISLELYNQLDLSMERATYITKLNVSLEIAIKNIKEDLNRE